MHKKILILEKDHITYLSMKYILVTNGYDVFDRVDSLKGLIFSCKRSKPDLIISDLIFSKKDYSDFHIVNFLISLQIPFLIVSAASSKVELDAKFAPKEINYISKPFDPNLFVDTIASII